ncbi:uncharacterized protein UV8b_06421 [Ustilaginoidea virens]|uniref:Uncharacterized protein n=1 Tax=Ustilaginoidea virens TaxID=1159556 RepID=A0A1B5KZE3_USTVR|nr:uncharacterized protein UV8b_06421 [Ustilaginoidea virens]QUC22180.1 hypothetical protein UV8b_06421 [Ustilaginoidea virens]GAO16405.1 hypothetical protein UVI_02047720 [Ustilaginoidea virens]
MSSSLKNELTVSDLEVDSHALRSLSRSAILNTIHSLRVVMTALALSAGIAILGLSADTLFVYNSTHLPTDFLLPLWPENLDLRPTNALVAGSVIATAMNMASILASKAPSIRGRVKVHSSISLIVPLISFIASLVAMVLFYAINTSTTVDTFQSWTCRWKSVPMSSRPHFGTLCKESQAALALSMLLVPLELLILVAACFQTMLEKKG